MLGYRADFGKTRRLTDGPAHALRDSTRPARAPVCCPSRTVSAPVHQHVPEALGRIPRIGIGRPVVHLLVVEEHQVGAGAFADHPAVREAELLCGKAGHLVDGRLQAEGALLSHVVLDDPRVGPVRAGMRLALALRESIRAHHGGGMREHGGHVGLAHHVGDGCDGKLFLDEEIEDHVEDALPPQLGDLKEALALVLRVPLGRAHDHHLAQLADDERQDQALGEDAIEDPRQLSELHEALVRVVDDALSGRWILQPLEELVLAPLEGPERDEHRAQHRGTRGVGVDVAVHVHASGPRVLHQLQGLLHLAPVEAPARLVVRDLEGNVRLLGDADGLFHRLHEARALVAHVGRVEASVLRHHLGERDDLFGLGIRSRRVHQARREAERPLLHRQRHRLPHRLELARPRRPLVEAHGRTAHVPVGDQRRDVHADASPLERFALSA
jgi:hypothetical protein